MLCAFNRDNTVQLPEVDPEALIIVKVPGTDFRICRTSTHSGN